MYDLEEQEQIDALKSWWKQHSRRVMGVALGALLAAGGVRVWQYYQQREATAAGQLFESVRETARSGDAARTLTAAQRLEREQPDSAMAPRAGLIAAAVARLKGQDEAALGQLTWVEGHAKEMTLVELAHLREAGILADQKHYDQALQRLSLNKEAEFAALTQDLRGDILLAMGRIDDARSAYRMAAEKSQPLGALHQLAQTKEESLGGKL